MSEEQPDRNSYGRFATGHTLSPKVRVTGSAHPKWKGGTKITRGRLYVWMPEHPASIKSGYVLESRLIAEAALGKHLPPKAVVHHHTPTDLVLCEDEDYHKFIEARTRAWKACGNPNWRKCRFCKEYNNPGKLHINGANCHHPECQSAYDKARRN